MHPFFNRCHFNPSVSSHACNLDIKKRMISGKNNFQPLRELQLKIFNLIARETFCLRVAFSASNLLSNVIVQLWLILVARRRLLVYILAIIK